MFTYFYKKGCGACDAVKAQTLKKFEEGVDYESVEISTEDDWDEHELEAVPAFKWADSAGNQKIHYGIIGPVQLKHKLK